ncbi:MAG: pyridoxal-phosphate dependent enzyme [Candidatus Heimdallarchaeota archaeon]|nr:pyridoxal-phosphate dependent enzyme [Candidatus Heimdallarchaeota archaeon]
MWKNLPKCNDCGNTSREPQLTCPKCKGLISIPPISGPSINDLNLSSMWSLNAFLPNFSKPISLVEGNTPLLPITNIENYQNLSLKLEFRNPTGSFRDRACSLIISDAVEKNVNNIIGASTGSFSISLAAYAAKARINSVNVVPQNLELSKIEQIKVYGGIVVEKGESVDEAINHSLEMQKNSDSYYASPENNLLTIEGQKTIGLELALQKDRLDCILVPRGSGSLIYSIYRGFEDAISSGWIEEYPKIYAISLEKTQVAHLAESLEVQEAFLLDKVKKIIQETEGKEIEIDAESMLDEALELAKNEGLFIEPSSASVLVAAKSLIKEKEITAESTVAILSGSGMNTLNVYAARLRGKKKIVWGLSESSTTKFEILNLIADKKADYGYFIWISLGKNQSLQSIYQHLTELEEKGLIVPSEKEVKRKHYELTKKGLETLVNMRNLIDYL